MARKRGTLGLGAMKAQKTATEARSTAPAPSTPGGAEKAATEARVGMTIRLTPAAHRQLKHLAVDRGVKAHDLLTEGLNLVFAKAHKPPIA